MAPYTDIGGLRQKYGVEQTTSGTGGEYRTNGRLREIEFVLTLNAVNFPFGATNYILDENVFLPAGVRLQEVETLVETAGAGATATLDIGLLRTDATTVTSANGILAAKTVASMTTGEKATLSAGSGGFTGALIGTTTANVNYVTARVNTANFTAGVIRITIRYYRP